MSITFDAAQQLLKLDTPHTTYAMQVREGRLLHLYWGQFIAETNSFPVNEQLFSHRHEESVRKERVNEEYAAWGGYFFDEPAIKVAFSDGVRDLHPSYVEHRVTDDVDAEILSVTLADATYALTLELHYRIYRDTDVIERWSTVRNNGGSPVTIQSLQSATWYPREGRGHRLTHLAGRWGAEHQIQRSPITQAKTTIESRRGVSGADANPWFAIDEEGAATETTGHVWFGVLHWSGNWKIVVEQDRWDQVRVTGGYNDFDFDLSLSPGERHDTPIFAAAFTNEGFGGASDMMHRYERAHVAPQRLANVPRPVIFNSWEVFWFDINANQQKALAERAAEIGSEVFVVDDGWFGARDDDRAGLGDWAPNPRKFPNGLQPLSARVRELGMIFGLWVEPEMVNPNSDLYRAHPDWAIGFPTRPGTLVRNQLVLNLARQDVRDWTLNWLDALVRDNVIGYLKWDMNRYITEPGDLAGGESRLWIPYVENLYFILAELRKRHPDLIIENCCSGGGRADYGMARYTDLVSRSDNGDALDILKLHEGFTQAYPPIIAGGGIGEVPNGINGRSASLRYRAHAGMLGAFHVSVNLFTLSPEETAELTDLVALFKDIRHIVHLGLFHRLVSAWTHSYGAYQYVTEDGLETVVFLLGQFQQFQEILPRLRLRGLQRERLYSVPNYKPMTGEALMNLGLPVELRGDYDSKVIPIRVVE